MTPQGAAGSRVRFTPSIGDIALAVAIAVAAGLAAAGATGDEPLRGVLVLLAFSAGLSLAARSLYPIPVFAITVLTTSFFALAYDGYWPFAALLAFYSVAAHSRRGAAAIAGGTGLLVLGASIAHLINWESLTWSKLALFAGRLAPLVAAWILGDNVRTRRAYVRAVEDRAEQLEREQEANSRRAAAEEQARVAREVHDVVAHNLSVIIVQATAADAVFATDPADARRAVRTIGTTARQALDELRSVLGVVRIGEERSPGFPPQPTLARLDVLLDQVRSAGVAVDLTIDGERHELPSALESSAYRIVQEALTNTLRHAGANRAAVTLHFEPDALEVEVVDDGNASGSGNGGSGRGLIGMRERAAAFGGTVETQRIETGGFRVVARLPLASVGE